MKQEMCKLWGTEGSYTICWLTRFCSSLPFNNNAFQMTTVWRFWVCVCVCFPVTFSSHWSVCPAEKPTESMRQDMHNLHNVSMSEVAWIPLHHCVLKWHLITELNVYQSKVNKKKKTSFQENLMSLLQNSAGKQTRSIKRRTTRLLSGWLL